MPMINPAIAATFRPPVMEARRWLEGVQLTMDRPLINVSQAAPTDPPPESLRRAISEASLYRNDAHFYGPVLGNHDLRQTIAQQFSTDYRGSISAQQVAVTQGCNQAFCAAITTLAGAGDEVILPSPWYFNHRMWLEMNGIATVPLACGAGMLPDPDLAATLITPRTRAIVLVTPNNPTGAEYPPALIRRFYALCAARGITLVLDETYRDFHSLAHPGGPAHHDLFVEDDWGNTLIQLYSFSKAYRMTGHRVGALIASDTRMIEVEKWLDAVAISVNQLGQIGAIYGMRHLKGWLADERYEILSRVRRARSEFSALQGWTLKSCGAYFAWLEHPYADSSADLAPRLVREAGVLALPGTMFVPEGDPQGARHFRIAFANIDADAIAVLADRLRGFRG